MRLNFGHPVSWAVGLGLLAAAIVGSTVPARTSAQEVRHVLGFLFLFAPTVYLLIDRQRTLWEAKHPYVRFVVFTLTTMVVTVVLVQVSILVAGTAGFLARALGFLAGVAGFGTAVWMTFFGGAERLWELFLDRTDTEW